MNEIPKIVHYCWFGSKAKPESVLKYINSWKEKLVDYEFIEWNETNFDIDCCKYVREAYNEKKFAFVSDYARLYGLNLYGGVYFDTDVEVCKPFDELLKTGCLTFGFEEFNYIATSTIISPKGSAFIEAFLLDYHNRSFYDVNKKLDLKTNVQVLTDRLVEIGCRLDNTEQELNFNGERINILEQVKLSPFDYANHLNKANESTYSIHHFGQSWAGFEGKANRKIKTAILSIIGGENLKKLRSIIK